MLANRLPEQSSSPRRSQQLLHTRDKAKDLFNEALNVSSHAMGAESNIVTREEGLRKSNNMLFESLQKITREIEQTQWQSSDLLRVMQCYKAIIHNLINSKRKLAYEKAAILCDYASMFFDTYTNDRNVDSKYYFEAIEINLMYVRYACAHYSNQKQLTPEIKTQLSKLIAKACSIIDCINVGSDNLDLMRSVSNIYVNICSLYLDLNDSENALTFSLKSVRLLGRARQAGGVRSDDYLKLSELFKKMTSKFQKDYEYHALFDVACKFFSGNQFINVEYFNRVVAICSDSCDQYDLGKVNNLLYLMKLIVRCSVDDALPDSPLKMELRHADQVKLLQKLQDRENKLVDAACDDALAILNQQDDAREQKPAASVSMINIFLEMQGAVSQVSVMQGGFEKLARNNKK